MAGPDFLSQLPSLDELLEHPKVAAAIDRLNQSTAAARVRSAVSGLGAEISKRAEELQALTPGELLERVVRRIDEPRRSVATQVINATGSVLGPEWAQPPLPSAAIEAAQTFGQGYVDGVSNAAAEAATRLIGGCDAAVVFSSPVAGLSAALETLAGGGVCLIARGEMSELAPGVRLDEVCRRAGVELREVGATNATTLADYQAALPQDGAAAVVLRRSTQATEPALTELAGLTGATVLVDADGTRPRQDTPSYGAAFDSAEQMLREGAAAVVLDTAGLTGGPSAGLLVGKKTEVCRVADSSAARADGVAPMVDAALAATLELFAKPDSLRFHHPLYELLDAPIESLRSRAERLAPQIAAGERVASAVAVELSGDSPSWAVRIEPIAGATPSDLISGLADHDPKIVAAAEDQAVLLDLRAVFAREDRALAAAFRSQTPETPPNEPESDG